MKLDAKGNRGSFHTRKKKSTRVLGSTAAIRREEKKKSAARFRKALPRKRMNPIGEWNAWKSSGGPKVVTIMQVVKTEWILPKSRSEA